MKREVNSEFEKSTALSDVLAPEEALVYSRWLHLMNRSGVDYVVGGGFALFAYTGVWRSTKDLDIFLRPADLRHVLEFMSRAGYQCEVTYPEWLAKVLKRPFTLDLIFGGNLHGYRVDDRFLSRSRPVRLLEASTRLMSPEALFASKAHVARHHRFDGADIARLIHSLRGDLDWQLLLEHLQGHFELLLWHLLFFGFLYPEASAYLPRALMASFSARLRRRWTGAAGAEDGPRPVLPDPAVFEADCRLWGSRQAPGAAPLVNGKGDAL